MSKSELKQCTKPGCVLYAIPEKQYCFRHSSLEEPSKKKLN